MTDSDITRQAGHAARTLRRDRTQGEALFDELLQEHPRDGMVFLQRAKAREAVGLVSAARDDYRRAADLLKYPSWIAEARAGISRLTEGQDVPSSASESVLVPTAADFAEASRIFQEREPRAVVYEAALVLLESAYDDPEHLSPVVAVAALIQSWNFAYYKSTSCDSGHVVDLEFALHSLRNELAHFRERDITTFAANADAAMIRHVFNTLEGLLGRVGAAKAMHVLAPRFFPLWDNPIAEAYGFTLGAKGHNADVFLAFMHMVQRQAAEVRRVVPHRHDVLKAIDEYNYCRFSKGWI